MVFNGTIEALHNVEENKTRINVRRFTIAHQFSNLKEFSEVSKFIDTLIMHRYDKIFSNNKIYLRISMVVYGKIENEVNCIGINVYFWPQ